jgi:hypothetical protein
MVYGHRLGAPVAGAPAAMVGDLVGGRLSNAPGTVSLDVAVAPRAVGTH